MLKTETMRSEQVSEVARLHAAVLGDTLNSRLGPRILEPLYSAVSSDPLCRACVVVKDERIVGFATASLDIDASKARIESSFSLGLKVWAGLKLLSSPANIVEYISHWRLERFFKTLAVPYPIILTIGVAANCQGQGVGKLLLEDLDGFFRKNGLKTYYVDTLKNNAGARRFYEGAGFKLKAIFLRHSVYEKNLS